MPHLQVNASEEKWKYRFKLIDYRVIDVYYVFIIKLPKLYN